MLPTQSTGRKWSYEGIGYRLMSGGSVAIFMGFFSMAVEFYFAATSPVGLPLDYGWVALGLGFLGVGFLLVIWGLALLHRPKELKRAG